MEETNVKQKILDEIRLRRTEEIAATCKQNDILFSKLGISIDELSPKADELLTKMAMYQKIIDVKYLDEASVFTTCAEMQLEEMKYDRDILELRQNLKYRENHNERLRAENEKFKKELEEVKFKMSKKQTSEDIQQEISTLEKKIVLYEKNFADIKNMSMKMSIKPELWPDSLKLLMTEIDDLKKEREHLRIKADNIAAVQEAKQLHRNIFKS